MKTIVLLGDSTLDNAHWVDTRESVPEQLQKCHPYDRVINLAVDGFTTANVLHGGYRDKAVSDLQHEHTYESPLERLTGLGECDHIFLSVGGNDLREELTSLIQQTSEERKVSIQQLSETIFNNYISVIARIQQIKPSAKITVLLQYTPYSMNDHYYIYFLMSAIAKNKSISSKSSLALQAGGHYLTGLSIDDTFQAVETLHDIMADIYGRLFPALIEENISVLDLASSFNHNDPELYCQQIEPSHKGSQLIVRLMSKVIRDMPDKSVLYSMPSQVMDTNILQAELSTLAENWRPGRVYTSEIQAKRAFIQAYKEEKITLSGSLTKFSFMAAEEDDELSTLIALPLNEIIYEAKIDSFSSCVKNVLKRLGHLNHQTQYTPKTSCYEHEKNPLTYEVYGVTVHSINY